MNEKKIIGKKQTKYINFETKPPGEAFEETRH